MQKESIVLKKVTGKLRELDGSKWTSSEEQDSEIDGVSKVYSAQLGDLQVRVVQSRQLSIFGLFPYAYSLEVQDTNNHSTEFESYFPLYFNKLRGLFYAVDSTYHKYQRETRRQAKQANRTAIIGRLETALSNS